MLPILSKLFGLVFDQQKESPVIFGKCAFYYGILKQDPSSLEKHFLDFSNQLFDVPEDVYTSDPGEINSIALIYNKPPESFTKNLSYFSMQR